MICPQTKAECNLRTCGMLRWCAKTSRDPSPPPPTLAEIERLVDALETACIEYGATNHPWPTAEREMQAKMNAARAALMAAIRAYGRE